MMVIQEQQHIALGVRDRCAEGCFTGLHACMVACMHGMYTGIHTPAADD
jgi:hypothetical protein